MHGPTGDRWVKLCEQAAVEQDKNKLLKLTAEIARLLEERAKRLPERDERQGHH
jgi:hypothetical protein